MRNLVGGAALICGSLTGAAIASLLFLGPTLGVSPFGHDSPRSAPRTLDLPSGLSARAKLSRHNRAGALGAAGGAAFATGSVVPLPVGGGSATGGPTVLRPGGAARADSSSGVPSGAGPQPFGGSFTGSGVVGSSTPSRGAEKPSGGGGAGNAPSGGGSAGGSGSAGSGSSGGGSDGGGQGSIPAPVTPPTTSGEQTAPTGAGSQSGSTGTGATTGDGSGTSGASSGDPTPVTPPPTKTHDGNSTAVLIAKVARKGGEGNKGLANALGRHGIPFATGATTGSTSDAAPATTSDESDDAGAPSTDSSKQGRGTGYDQARGRHDDGGDGRGGRPGRGSGEESDS